MITELLQRFGVPQKVAMFFGALATSVLVGWLRKENPEWSLPSPSLVLASGLVPIVGHAATDAVALLTGVAAPKGAPVSEPASAE